MESDGLSTMGKVALAASLIPIAVLGYLIYQALNNDPQTTPQVSEQEQAERRQVLQTEAKPFSGDLNQPDKRMVIYPTKPKTDNQESATTNNTETVNDSASVTNNNRSSTTVAASAPPVSTPEPAAAPPAPVITSAPSGKISNRDPQIRFTGSGELRCSLNQKSFAAARVCGSPQVFASLSDRRYVFRVWSVVNGQRSPAAKQAFTVAANPPSGARIISAPKKWSNSRSAKFVFRANQEDLNFLCSIDSRALQPCTSPFVINGLADGWHRFRVQTVNSLGVKSAVIKKRRFNVDTVAPGAPILITTPEPETTSSTAQFTFRSAEAGNRFRCSLTVGLLPQSSRLAAARACRSGVSYQNLQPGAYFFTVVAIDRAGNVSVPSEYQFARVLDVEPATQRRASIAESFQARSGDNPPTGYDSGDQGSGARQSQAVTLEIDPAIEVLNVATSNDIVSPQAGGDGGADDAAFIANVALRSNLGWSSTANQSQALGLIAGNLLITGDQDTGGSNGSIPGKGDGTQSYSVDMAIDISWADDASPESTPYVGAINHNVSNSLVVAPG